MLKIFNPIAGDAIAILALEEPLALLIPGSTISVKNILSHF